MWLWILTDAFTIKIKLNYILCRNEVDEKKGGNDSCLFILFIQNTLYLYRLP